MSFVICVCGMNFSTIMSDGRLVKLPNNIVVREDVSKVLKINKNVAIAYTGDPIPTQIAIEKLKEYDFGNLSMESIEEILITQLRQLRSNVLGVRLILTGRNEEDKFTIHNINSDNDFAVDIIYPSTDAITYTCAGNDDRLCNKVIEHNFSNVQIRTSEQLENIMSKCICDVAKYDNTVNTNIFKVVII